MTYYIGGELNQNSFLGKDNPRFLYAIRRTDEGVLYTLKIDQVSDDDQIIINDPGLSENDFQDFEYGVDFFDGRSEADHSRPYTNLHWDQYRWDDQNAFYFIDDNGNFIVRINRSYTYPAGSQVA